MEAVVDPCIIGKTSAVESGLGAETWVDIYSALPVTMLNQTINYSGAPMGTSTVRHAIWHSIYPVTGLWTSRKSY